MSILAMMKLRSKKQLVLPRLLLEKLLLKSSKSQLLLLQMRYDTKLVNYDNKNICA